MMIFRSDLIAGSRQVITKFLNDILSNLIFCRTGSRHENCTGRRFSTFDTFRMIMRNFCRQLSEPSGLFNRIIKPSHRRHSHSRAISPATIRLRLPVSKQPVSEPSAVTRIRIISPPNSHCFRYSMMNRFIIRFSIKAHQCLSHGYCHHRIICKLCSSAEKWKIFCFISSVKLIGCTNHVT